MNVGDSGQDDTIDDNDTTPAGSQRKTHREIKRYRKLVTIEGTVPESRNC